MDKLEGCIGIGHTRYSTAGSSSLHNAQPFVVETAHGTLAIAHNGQVRKSVLVFFVTFPAGLS